MIRCQRPGCTNEVRPGSIFCADHPQSPALDAVCFTRCADLMFGGLLPDDTVCELPAGHAGPHQAHVLIPDLISGRASTGIELGEPQGRIAEWANDGAPWFLNAGVGEA